MLYNLHADFNTSTICHTETMRIDADPYEIPR